MANNYSITRQTLESETYGCTDFSTLQKSGEVASLSGQTPLDGTIKWEITAHTGYGVDAVDFTINNATVVNSPSTTFVWTGGDLPSDVLGVMFHQFSPTVIEVTIYLHPDANYGITGGAYTMPRDNVLISIPITGCAKLLRRGIHVTVREETDANQVITVLEGSGITKATNTVGIYTEHLLTGSLLTDREKQTSIATYTTTANSGYYYSTQSNYTIPSADYTITRTAFTKNTSGFYTSETFNITYGSANEVGVFDNHLIDYTNTLVAEKAVTLEVSSLQTSLEPIDKNGEARRLVATGDINADYDLIINRQNGDTYDFSTYAFTSAATKLRTLISGNGTTTTSVSFPSSTVKERYSIWLTAVTGSTLHQNVPSPTNPMYIFQYPEVRITIDGESDIDAFEDVTGASSILVPPNTDIIDSVFDNTIEVNLTITPKAGESLTIINADPTANEISGRGVIFSNLTANVSNDVEVPLANNTNIPIGAIVTGASVTAVGDYIGTYLSSSGDGLASKFSFTNTSPLAAGMLVSSYADADVPEGITIVQADIESGEQIVMIDSDALNWMDPQHTVDFKFTLPFTTAKIPPFTTVQDKTNPNKVILSNNITANSGEILSFDFGGIEVLDSKLTAALVGNNVNITGTVTISKSGSLDAVLKLKLDNIITSA